MTALKANDQEEKNRKQKRHTTFKCGAQVENSRSQLRRVERGATTKCGQATPSPTNAAIKAMLCMVFPAFEQHPQYTLQDNKPPLDTNKL
jgi:hypothetical protein